MTGLLWVGVVLFGGAGAVLRFVVDRAVDSRTGRAFPYGTLVVNLTGSALLGLIAGLTLSHDAVLLAGTAAAGSYTTFSTWMFETQRLGEDRQMLNRAANVVVSLVAGVAAAALGRLLGSHL
ncbi:MAG: fluoride efflux transporter CrcB [Pseudonocardiales bacterium]|nr:MAG: fluoride efflux transporter CrcB [Pseudonocardiales bacterium]